MESNFADNTKILSELEVTRELEEARETPRQRALRKFGLAAVGAIPWIGGFLAVCLELRENKEEINDIQTKWLEQHAHKMERLQDTLKQIGERLENFGEGIDERLEDQGFLDLVEKGFRSWDASATEEKRDSVRRLLTNAAATAVCSDDLVRLFLDWIDRYDDTHFKIIRAIYKQNGITRRDIWLSMNTTIPRDDSSEADLFKLLIHDLSVGHVIRQQRGINLGGEYMKKKTGGKRTRSAIMKTPFDGKEPYELTELGQQFVHYVMNEVAPQIGRSN